MKCQQFLGLPIRGLEVDGRGFGRGQISIFGRFQFSATSGGVFDLSLVSGLATLNSLPEPRGVSPHLVGKDRLGRRLGVEEFFFASDEVGVVTLGFKGPAGKGL